MALVDTLTFDHRAFDSLKKSKHKDSHPSVRPQEFLGECTHFYGAK